MFDVLENYDESNEIVVQDKISVRKTVLVQDTVPAEDNVPALALNTVPAQDTDLIQDKLPVRDTVPATAGNGEVSAFNSSLVIGNQQSEPFYRELVSTNNQFRALDNKSIDFLQNILEIRQADIRALKSELSFLSPLSGARSYLGFSPEYLPMRQSWVLLTSVLIHGLRQTALRLGVSYEAVRLKIQRDLLLEFDLSDLVNDVRRFGTFVRGDNIELRQNTLMQIFYTSLSWEILEASVAFGETLNQRINWARDKNDFALYLRENYPVCYRAAVERGFPKSPRLFGWLGYGTVQNHFSLRTYRPLQACQFDKVDYNLVFLHLFFYQFFDKFDFAGLRWTEQRALLFFLSFYFGFTEVMDNRTYFADKLQVTLPRFNKLSNGHWKALRKVQNFVDNLPVRNLGQLSYADFRDFRENLHCPEDVLAKKFRLTHPQVIFLKLFLMRVQNRSRLLSGQVAYSRSLN